MRRSELTGELPDSIEVCDLRANDVCGADIGVNIEAGPLGAKGLLVENNVGACIAAESEFLQLIVKEGCQAHESLLVLFWNSTRQTDELCPGTSCVARDLFQPL